MAFEFQGLEPVSADIVARIVKEHGALSSQYLTFIAEMGIGTCAAGTFHMPIPLEEILEHDSFKIGRSRAARLLFGGDRRPGVPIGYLIFADTGASWRYCLRNDGGDAVYVFDMTNGSVERDHVSFASFIEACVAGQ